MLSKTKAMLLAIGKTLIEAILWLLGLSAMCLSVYYFIALLEWIMTPNGFGIFMALVILLGIIWFISSSVADNYRYFRNKRK